MNKILHSFVAVAALSMAPGQKVEVQKRIGGQILHVQTALNHLTVLEMTEAVSTVAVGSPVFQSGVAREQSLYPTDRAKCGDESVCVDGVRALQLRARPCGIRAANGYFAIDQPVADPPIAPLSANRLGPSPVVPSPAEVLIDAQARRLYGSTSEQESGCGLLDGFARTRWASPHRYTIRNRTQKAYVPGAPQVVALNARGPRYRESLYLFPLSVEPRPLRHV